MSLGAALASVLATLGASVTRGAEVGVLRGDTSQHLLRQFPELTLFMVDAWSAVAPDSRYGMSKDAAALQHWSQHMANEQMAYSATEFAANRRVLLRGNSVTCANSIADCSLDFAFIDADHTYEGVLGDIAAWWPKVRQGGVLAGHDYGGKMNSAGLWGVSRAVNEFMKEQNLELHLSHQRIWWTRKELASSTSEVTRSGTGTVVRVLFGDLEKQPKLKREVQQALQRPWDRDVVEYFVAGTENAGLLKHLGAKRIRRITAEHLPEPAKRLGGWYLKPWLLWHASREYPELLAIDFDCTILREPDLSMWELLRRKTRGCCEGMLQASNVGYRRTQVPRIYRERSHPRRQFLSTSAVYCRDPECLLGWRQGFEDMIAHGFKPEAFTDEPPLLLYLDRRFGPLTPEEMVASFELPIQRHRRAIPEAKLVCNSELTYFTHR